MSYEYQVKNFTEELNSNPSDDNGINNELNSYAKQNWEVVSVSMTQLPFGLGKQYTITLRRLKRNPTKKHWIVTNRRR